MARIALDVETFRKRFETGARTYLFYMEPQFPSSVLAGGMSSNDATFLVKSTSLPSSSFEELVASWQGFDYKAAGKRTYDNWTVSFNVDWQANIRNTFVNWMDIILDPKKNEPALPTTYMKEQKIHLLGLDTFTPAITYTLKACWPSQVGEITLDYADSAYASFDVTFTYLYYTTGDTAGNASYATTG
jgi:hypothetical protein